jgi:hypothetical protein
MLPPSSEDLDLNQQRRESLKIRIMAWCFIKHMDKFTFTLGYPMRT